MDVKFVQTILKGTEMVEPRQTKKGITGVLNYSEAGYNVIDSLMYFGASAKKKRNSVILCSIFGNKLGVIVDEVVEFISLDELFIEENIDLNIYANDKYLNWSLDYQQRKILYPNYEKITKELSTTDLLFNMVF